MPDPTPEYIAHNIDNFLKVFEAFDARINERPNKAMYVKTSDRIALFAIYHGG